MTYALPPLLLAALGLWWAQTRAPEHRCPLAPLGRLKSLQSRSLLALCACSVRALRARAPLVLALTVRCPLAARVRVRACA